MLYYEYALKLRSDKICIIDEWNKDKFSITKGPPSSIVPEANNYDCTQNGQCQQSAILVSNQNQLNLMVIQAQVYRTLTST